MTQNTAKVINFPEKDNTFNLFNKKYNRPHCIIPIEDLRWVIEQAKTVQVLWNECWVSDQYGSRWMKLATSLSDKSFRLARQVLYAAGLFEFKRETCIDDTRKTAGWLVINLHGARRVEEFWHQNDGKNIPNDGKNIPNDGKNIPNDGKNIPNDGKNLPPISPETIEKTGVPDSLSISSESSQELLKGVTEKKENQAPPPALEGQVAACCEPEKPESLEEIIKKLRAKGEPRHIALAEAFEIRILRRNGQEEEADRRFYRSQFKQVSRWDIPDEKLNDFLALDKDVQIGFMNQFKATYKNKYEGYLFGCANCFKECMEYIKVHGESVAQFIRAKREQANQYWEYYEQRRAEILAGTAYSQPAN